MVVEDLRHLAAVRVEHEPYPFGIHGLIVPMFTPVRYEDGNVVIDTEKDVALVDNLIRGGADVIFILGNAGMFQKLTFEQKLTHIDTVIGAAAGRIPVVVGVSSPDIYEARRLTKESEARGASGVVFMPLYGKGDPVTNTLTIIRTVRDIPVVFYNNPDIQPDNASLSIDFLKKFAGDPRVIGVKNSTPDMETYTQMVAELTSDKFHVFMGYAPNIFAAIELLREKKITEFAGCVPVQANLNPQIFAKLLRMDGSVDDPQFVAFMRRFKHTKYVLEMMVKLGRVDRATYDVFTAA